MSIISGKYGLPGISGQTAVSGVPGKNNDYLLIKDLPGHKAGCILTMGPNYIYYIHRR